MITCSKLSLRARAAQRGLTYADIIDCVVAENGNGTVLVDETHQAYPQRLQGLGDYVANGLSVVGITKSRISRLAGGDCGCSRRQQWLNKFGQQYLGIGHTPSLPDAD